MTFGYTLPITIQINLGSTHCACHISGQFAKSQKDHQQVMEKGAGQSSQGGVL
jgi:hypothetical protein